MTDHPRPPDADSTAGSTEGDAASGRTPSPAAAQMLRTTLKGVGLMLLVGLPLFILGVWVGELDVFWGAFIGTRVLGGVALAGLVLLVAGAALRRPRLVLAAVFAWMSYGAGLLGGRLSYRIAVDDCGPSILMAERAIHDFERTHGRWPTSLSELGVPRDGPAGTLLHQLGRPPEDLDVLRTQRLLQRRLVRFERNGDDRPRVICPVGMGRWQLDEQCGVVYRVK